VNRPHTVPCFDSIINSHSLKTGPPILQRTGLILCLALTPSLTVTASKLVHPFYSEQASYCALLWLHH